MSITIEQAIAQYEQFANVCEHHGLTASQEEFEQLAAWLRELQERRKEPEIIRCGECKYHSHDTEYGYDWCNRTSGVFRVEPDDFCSMAERRTE